MPHRKHAHRSRLLEGMAQAVAARGYADATIADIVREAGVSRRTFYEHFGAKADCLVALYEASSHNALKLLQGAYRFPGCSCLFIALTRESGCRGRLNRFRAASRRAGFRPA